MRYGSLMGERGFRVVPMVEVAGSGSTFDAELHASCLARVRRARSKKNGVDLVVDMIARQYWQKRRTFLRRRLGSS